MKLLNVCLLLLVCFDVTHAYTEPTPELHRSHAQPLPVQMIESFPYYPATCYSTTCYAEARHGDTCYSSTWYPTTCYWITAVGHSTTFYSSRCSQRHVTQRSCPVMDPCQILIPIMDPVMDPVMEPSRDWFVAERRFFPVMISWDRTFHSVHSQSLRGPLFWNMG